MKNILNKLHNIMSEVGSLEKDKKNTMQNYEYLSEANVKHAIQPLLVEHGVILQVEVLNQVINTIGQTKSGNDMLKTDAEIRYSFYDIETGEVLSGIFWGSGTDTGDKGLYKAITGAIKYILTSTFLIPTGDDPENDSKETVKVTAKSENKIVVPGTQLKSNVKFVQDQDMGKATAIKVLYGVISNKGLDPKQYVPKIAALHGKATIGGVETDLIVKFAKDIRDIEPEYMNTYISNLINEKSNDSNVKSEEELVSEEFENYFKGM